MPVNLVNLEAVRKAYGTVVLLDGVSIGVAEGDRVGVVGPNGAGKSTLLGILADRVPLDSGRVTHTGGLHVGLLSQSDDLDPALTVRQAVVGDRAEHDWAGDARIRDVVGGLVGDLDLDASLAPLSGGERRRVALAALLCRDLDLLLLDEPTNHLDVEGIDWLARHLVDRRLAVVVVTHDRWFLDEVCDSTWEVAEGRVHTYEGGYSAYVLARAERMRLAAAAEERRQNLLRKELAWLRRGPPARTSKPQFRIDAANALIEGEPPVRDTVELQRFASARLGKDVYDVEDVTLKVGARVLLDDITWRLGPGDRVGLVGANGSGKTSLLRLLAQETPPSSGRVRVGRTVRTAHLSQAVAELDPARRVLEAVEEVAKVVDLGKGRELTASQLLERLGFGRTRQWTPVGDLSGGERRRLQLLRLLMAEPNVLLLDEPTNDLDIDTLTQLEDLLDGWPGTLVVVSHDRYFLERVCDTVYGLLGDGHLRHLPRGIEEYLQLRHARAVASEPAPAEPRRPKVDTRAARKELVRVERALERLERRERELHELMAEQSSDYEKVLALDEELREVLAEKERLEEQWLQLAE